MTFRELHSINRQSWFRRRINPASRRLISIGWPHALAGFARPGLYF